MAKFKWTVEIEVDEEWVADGFEVTPEQLQCMLGRALPYAYSHEYTGRIVSAPSPKAIRIAQGYQVSDCPKHPDSGPSQGDCNCEIDKSLIGQ